MPRRKPQASDKPVELKYFVPPSKKKSAAEPARVTTKSTKPQPKYFARTFPIVSELPELWDGTGPDLPVGYEGGEACPDCSAFRHSRHAPLCIRNPLQETFDLSAAWGAIHTKTQIFFGAGHPIPGDVDDYMTAAKQQRLKNLGVVVMYDFPDEKSRNRAVSDADYERRQVVASWRERAR